MSQAREERPQQSTMLARTEEIQKQIQHLSGRDLQLWSIGALVLLVLTAGFLALLLPNLPWAQHMVRMDKVEQGYLPQLFFGLISLILLFNIYLLTQKLSLNSTRHALIRELVLNERLESLSLIDPLTQLPNRRAMNEMIPREVMRANRIGSPLTLMAVDLKEFRAINSRFGSLEGDMILMEFAKILKVIFRGGDLVFRQAGDEFLILMPDTSEEQCDFPVRRLLQAVEQWNLNNMKDYKLAVHWGVSPYIPGTDVTDTLRAVDRKMYHKKNMMVPVF